MPHRFRATLIATGLSLFAAAAPAQNIHSGREVTVSGISNHISMDTLGHAVRVSVTTDQAWASLKEAYARLRIRTELNDSAAGVLGNMNVLKTYSMGPLSMSQVFDCGSGPSGPLADQGRIHVAIISYVTPAAGDSSDVRTALIATADYIDGSARAVALCATSGALESWLLDYVAPRSMRRH